VEECLEGLVYPVKDILQSLAVHIGEIRAYLFTLHQLSALLSKADAFAGHTVGIPAMLQSRIIQLSAQVEVMLQQPSLPGGGAKAVFICAPDKHY
jgi:hypothetical protein